MSLTAAQKQFYDDHGYLLIKGLLSPAEAADLRQATHDLAARLQQIRNIDATWASIREANPDRKLALLHCHDVQFHDARFARLIVDPRLTAVAQGLIGPNIQLHHTKMFIKPPEKGAPFPMHQDYPYFPHDHNTMIAAIVHLDDAPVAKGCLRVIPGSHKLGPIKTDRPDHSLSLEEYPIEQATPVEAAAGDAIFFSYLTIHGSGVNVSNEARTTVLVQMRDPADPPSIRTHESRGQGMMLAGFDPTAASPHLRVPATAYPATGAAMGENVTGPQIRLVISRS